MQKKIIALAIAAAFAAPAVAMAEASFYGSMDGGLRHQSNEGAAGTTDSMQMGQYNTGRWGFKASDDLGDGMKANVAFETSLVPASVGTQYNGTVGSASNPFGLIFDRQATVGLSSGIGSFDMGWNYTAAFKAITAVDPMGAKFYSSTMNSQTSYAAQTAFDSRSGNLTFTVPAGPMTVIAQYVVNNASATTAPTSGAGRALAVLYTEGDVFGSASYSTRESSVGSDTPATNVTAGIGYNYGMGKVSVTYGKRATKTTASDDTNTTMSVGGSYNISSATTATLAYYTNATNTGGAGVDDVKKNKVMAMVTYAMSKRTTLYAEIDRETKSAFYADGGNQVTSGTSIGLNTSF